MHHDSVPEEREEDNGLSSGGSDLSTCDRLVVPIRESRFSTLVSFLYHSDARV